MGYDESRERRPPGEVIYRRHGAQPKGTTFDAARPFRLLTLEWGGVPLSDGRDWARWFLGAMLGLPALEYVFSFSGAYILVALLPNGLKQSVFSATIAIPAFAWLWLGVGLVMAFAGYAAAVGWAGAPKRLWYVALGLSVASVAGVAAQVAPSWVVDAQSAPDAVREALSGAIVAQYGSAELLFAALIGYTVLAFLGCFVGGRLAARRRAPGPEPCEGTT